VSGVEWSGVEWSGVEWSGRSDYLQWCLMLHTCNSTAMAEL
jgi:hypothetical protein